MTNFVFIFELNVRKLFKGQVNRLAALLRNVL